MPRPLGTSHALITASRAHRTYITAFGIEDFHSHFRWRAIQRYIDWDAERTVEVGANSGVMTFELAPRLRGEIVASEFAPSLLDRARQIQAHRQHTNLTLGHADLRELALDGAAFDQAFVIDVLEHIDDDRTAAAELASALRPGGRLILSVPTPNYPKVFGRQFHTAIGHVRDGYWFNDMRDLLRGAGFEVASHHYYTGRLASFGCSVNYRSKAPGVVRYSTMPILRQIGYLGERNVKPENAASLAVLAFRR